MDQYVQRKRFVCIYLTYGQPLEDQPSRFLNWMDTYQGLIAPGAIGAFGIFWIRGQIAEVPDELLDAGRIDGCSKFGL